MVPKYGKLALGVCLSMAHTSLPNRSLQFRVKAPLSCVNHFPLSKLQVPTLAAVCTFRESWYLPPAAWSKSLRGEAAAFSLAVKFLGFSPLCMFWVSHLWSADFKNIPLAFFFFSVAISKAKKDHKIIYMMTWDILPIILRRLTRNQEIATCVNNLLTYLVLYLSLSSFYLNSRSNKWFMKIAQSPSIRYVLLVCTAFCSPQLKQIKILLFSVKENGEMDFTENQK